jgi:hypothetical protein
MEKGPRPPEWGTAGIPGPFEGIERLLAQDDKGPKVISSFDSKFSNCLAFMEMGVKTI